MNLERVDRIRKEANEVEYVDLYIWFSTTNLRETSLKKLDFYDNRVTLTSKMDVKYYIVLDPINNPMKMEYFEKR